MNPIYDSLPVVRALPREPIVATTCLEMKEIALRQMNGRFSSRWGYAVSFGPISTGGKNSLKENLITFERQIIYVALHIEANNLPKGSIGEKCLARFRPCPVWSQAPFEKPIQDWKKNEGTGDLMKDFYIPVLRIFPPKVSIFNDAYTSSIGTMIEYSVMEELGVTRIILPTGWEEEAKKLGINPPFPTIRPK